MNKTKSMHAAQVLEHLELGWELANRGCGWWISTPQKPYERSESLPVLDRVVQTLVNNKQVAIKENNMSAQATLCPKA